MALAALTAQQAAQLAQGGDKFIFTNDASTGQSLGGAHIPASQVQNLAALTGGIVPENLTFSNGRIYAADANGSMVDVTPYVDMSSYLPHDQTAQTSADSLLKTIGKFGLASAGAYGAANMAGQLVNGLLPPPTGTEGDWYNLPNGQPAPSGTFTPTGTESDWYNLPDGTPAPSGSHILPDGTITPTPVPGSVPLAPPPVVPPVTPIPTGTTVPTPTPAPTGTPGIDPGKLATDAAGNIDWGKVIAGIVGAVGASNMADAYKETADKYMKLGEPSRDRYEASFAPGFTMMNDPGYKDAMDSVGKESATAMSMHGNPADSPNAWKQTQLDVYNKVAYPALQGYRQTNASAGGLASFASAVPAADTAAIGATQNIWNAGGSIANNLFSPPQTNNSFDWQKFAKSMGWA